MRGPDGPESAPPVDDAAKARDNLLFIAATLSGVAAEMLRKAPTSDDRGALDRLHGAATLTTAAAAALTAAGGVAVEPWIVVDVGDERPFYIGRGEWASDLAAATPMTWRAAFDTAAASVSSAVAVPLSRATEAARGSR